VAALGDGAAVLEDDDHVRGQDRADPLRHQEDRALAHERSDGVLHARLGCDIERARRVVEDEDGRRAHERSRDREPLPLPAGEVRAPPLHLAPIAVRSVLDERRRFGRPGRRHHV
jgi:hypothetical protein